jgi:ferrochelatase
LGGPSEDRPASGQVRFLFTAHSLPASIVEEGDPYEAELLETCSLLAGQLGLPGDRWQFCYQSAGATGARWLGPKAEDVLVELCDAGHKDIVVVPVGFVADHVEVLYDIDVVLRELAAVHGAHLERAESLNTCATFIAGLADLVRGATGA